MAKPYIAACEGNCRGRLAMFRGARLGDAVSIAVLGILWNQTIQDDGATIKLRLKTDLACSHLASLIKFSYSVVPNYLPFMAGLRTFHSTYTRHLKIFVSIQQYNTPKTI